MGSYSGTFQYLDETGVETQQGPCRVTIEPPNLFVTPQKGPSLSVDLGDIDFLDPGDYELSLTPYTGKRLVLTRFAKAFQDLSSDLLHAYKDRLVECLLLDDLEEIDRFEGYVDIEAPGAVFSSPAEVRLYESNLAILPRNGIGLQWRLAEIDDTEFEDAAYRLVMRSGDSRIALGKLAKRTGEFVERLQSAREVVSRTTAAVVGALCPFLSPDQALEACRLMREGRAAAFSRLNKINPAIEPSMIANAVDSSLKPYFGFLRQQVAGGEWFGGFKMIRPEADVPPKGPVEPDGENPATANMETEPTEGEPQGEGDEEGRAALHWFFFPLRSGAGERAPKVIAWESTSHSGRATYFFKMAAGLDEDGLESGVRRLNDALILLNFRREPIYLSDATLQTDLRYRRYAIACRRMDALRELRASYLGRAIHTSPEAWQTQVETILGRR